MVRRGLMASMFGGLGLQRILKKTAIAPSCEVA